MVHHVLDHRTGRMFSLRNAGQRTQVDQESMASWFLLFDQNREQGLTTRGPRGSLCSRQVVVVTRTSGWSPVDVESRILRICS